MPTPMRDAIQAVSMSLTCSGEPQAVTDFSGHEQLSAWCRDSVLSPVSSEANCVARA